MKSTVNDLEIHRESVGTRQEVCAIVLGGDPYAKDTLGEQIVRSADSMAANLAEGHGRLPFKETQKFCADSRGSAEETQAWLETAARRHWVDRESARVLYDRLETYKKRLNASIRSIGSSENPFR